MSKRDSTHPIPFGLGEHGRLFPVRDVRRGAECGCVCPRCRAPLIARKGDIRAHHFAHAPGVRPCEGGAETALHLMAKQIVKAASSIALPKLTVSEPETTQPWQSRPCEVTVCPPETMAIVRSRLESTEDRFRPDVVVWDGRWEVWIEIRVAHRVSQYKHDELRARGIGCLEADLRNFDPRWVELADLERALLEETDRKVWLTHPNEAAARVRARDLWDEREQARRQSEAPRSHARNGRRASPQIVSARPALAVTESPRVRRAPEYRWLVCPACKHMGNMPYNPAHDGRRFRCRECGAAVEATSALHRHGGGDTHG